MTWTHFYLFCFAIGLAFSVLSFIFGGLHWHLPLHFHLHGGPLIHTGHHVPVKMVTGNSANTQTPLHAINPVTIAAFLAWFGGCGYLLTRYSSLIVIASLGLATVSGMAGASVIVLFLNKVLMSDKGHMDPADYEMVGVLGRLSIPIRENGTGELIYSQAGTRRTCGARSDDGKAVEKGTEVVVTRYEKGIAYVRLWTDLAGDDHASEHAVLEEGKQS